MRALLKIVDRGRIPPSRLMAWGMTVTAQPLNGMCSSSCSTRCAGNDVDSSSISGLVQLLFQGSLPPPTQPSRLPGLASNGIMPRG